MNFETRSLDPNVDWCFFDEGVSIGESDLLRIRPLTERSARSCWERFVCTERTARHPMLLPRGHWLGGGRALGVDWQSYWNSPSGPDPVVEFFTNTLAWPETTPGVFFWMRERAVAVPWGTFLRTWRAFLFSDEGPFYLCLDSPQVAWFGPNGQVGVCTRTGEVDSRS